MKFNCPTLSLALVFILSGCTTPQFYRSNSDVCITSGSRCERSVVVVNQSPDSEVRPTSIMIVELDEQGQYIDRDLKESVSGHLKSINGSKLVLLFVHGWHHNARYDDDNFLKFSAALSALQEVEDQAREKERRTVVGIYVGWRGKVTWDLPNYLTFFSRKSVSEEVGRGALKDLILDTESQLIHDSTTDKNVFVLVGHSFGASALFNAVEPILLSRLHDSLSRHEYNLNDPAEPVPPIQGIGNMIVLVNPAIEAMRFNLLREEVWRAGWKNPKIFDGNLKPILLTIGSAGDWATGITFPIGRAVNGFFENHKKIKIAESSIPGREIEVDEKILDKRSIGNYAPFYTHWIKSNTLYDKEVHGNFSKFCPPDTQWLKYAIRSGSLNTEGYSLNPALPKDVDVLQPRRPLPFQLADQFISSKRWSQEDVDDGKKSDNTWARNPYWFVRANKNIIWDHNAIWSPEAACFIIDLIAAESDRSVDEKLLAPVNFGSPPNE